MSALPVVVLYSKPGCCLCETLEATLRKVQQTIDFVVEVRDITTSAEWFADFQYTIPVLEVADRTVPGISHRIAAQQLGEQLAAILGSHADLARLESDET